jgi:hypothetical protein
MTFDIAASCMIGSTAGSDEGLRGGKEFIVVVQVLRDPLRSIACTSPTNTIFSRQALAHASTATANNALAATAKDGYSKTLGLGAIGSARSGQSNDYRR